MCGKCDVGENLLVNEMAFFFEMYVLVVHIAQVEGKGFLTMQCDALIESLVLMYLF